MSLDFKMPKFVYALHYSRIQDPDPDPIKMGTDPKNLFSYIFPWFNFKILFPSKIPKLCEIFCRNTLNSNIPISCMILCHEAEGDVLGTECI